MKLLRHLLILLLLPLTWGSDSPSHSISSSTVALSDTVSTSISPEKVELRPEEGEQSITQSALHKTLQSSILNKKLGVDESLSPSKARSNQTTFNHTQTQSSHRKRPTVAINPASQKTAKSTTNDECKFVSFEEWKKLKEAEHKSESPTTMASSNTKSSSQSSKALLDLSVNTTTSNSVVVEEPGKTYKDKFNYASVNCAATVVKTNSDAKGASAILTEVKDSYLINKCSTPNKFIVIELCQDILINLVVMGNYELFSSMFKQVKFQVSDRFPVVDGWRELGQFEARNIRDVQSFEIKNPLIWARYLKIEILSHYGNEFYCPISLVRVHGTTMMEEVKNTDVNIEKESPEKTSEAQGNLLNYTEEIELEECRARLPYLALNDFLTELNTTKEYCDLRESNETISSVAATNSIVTQESIFQNIIKRLSLLESNSTLSLLYFEEQSKLLSEAFSKLEKRQNKRFENFTHRVNSTIVAQTMIFEQKLRHDMQQLLEHFKKSVVKAQTSTDEKLLILARELSLQRKIITIETLIVLFLLAYVTLTRETRIAEHGDVAKKKEEEPASPSTPQIVKSRRKRR